MNIKTHRLAVPIVAVLAMLLSLGLIFGLIVSNQANIQRNCKTNLKTWNTLNVIIDHVGQPPTLIGQRITPIQKAALLAYAENLRSALPTKPEC